MLRNIVVGLDGSPSGRRALEWAVDAAADEVHAVHAVSPAMELIAAGFQIDTRPLIERLTALLEGEWTADLHLGGTKLFTHLVEDSPCPALFGIAGSSNADAIAVGDRGHGPSPKMVGATTSRLTHLSDRPIVVVPSGAHVAEHDDPDVAVIGVADDLREDAELMSWACHAARDSRTRLDVVHSEVSRRVSARKGKQPAADRDRSPARRIGEWLAGQQYPNPFRVLVVSGDPITALLEASKDASLIVVGSHRSSRLAAYLTGALANHLPTVSHCPVAIVPLTAIRP